MGRDVNFKPRHYQVAGSFGLRANPWSRFSSVTEARETKNVSGACRHLPLVVSTAAVSQSYIAWKYKH
jgi:hypothetical protein